MVIGEIHVQADNFRFEEDDIKYVEICTYLMVQMCSAIPLKNI